MRGESERNSTYSAGLYDLFVEARMGAVPVELDQDLVALLEELQRPAKEAIKKL